MINARRARVTNVAQTFSFFLSISQYTYLLTSYSVDTTTFVYSNECITALLTLVSQPQVYCILACN